MLILLKCRICLLSFNYTSKFGTCLPNDMDTNVRI